MFCPSTDNNENEAAMKNTSREYERFYTRFDRYDKEIDGIYHNYCVRHGITDVALWIYYALYTFEGEVTQADICDCWFLPRQSINTSLKALEKAGEIVLVPMENNRKSKCVRFTESGAKKADGIMKPLFAAEDEMLSTFTEEELQTLLDLQERRCAALRKLTENL